MKKLIVMALFFLVSVSFVFAHAMFLILVEPGVFKVEYDGGGFTPGTKVVLFSDAGFEEIEEGVVDGEGFFRFDKNLKVVSASASDGAGHKAYWDAPKTGEESTMQSKLLVGGGHNGSRARPSKLPIVLTVLNTFAIIFLFFEFRIFKKKYLR